MKRAKCLVGYCNRSTSWPICGRHWALVSGATKLAIGDLGALHSKPRDADEKALRDFYAWAWWQTMRGAAHEAYDEEVARRWERLNAEAALRKALADPLEATRAALSARRRRRGLARGPP